MSPADTVFAAFTVKGLVPNTPKDVALAEAAMPSKQRRFVNRPNLNRVIPSPYNSSFRFALTKQDESRIFTVSDGITFS